MLVNQPLFLQDLITVVNKFEQIRMKWRACYIMWLLNVQDCMDPLLSFYASSLTWASFLLLLSWIGFEHCELWMMWCHGQQWMTNNQCIVYLASSRFCLVTQLQTTLSNCLIKSCNLLVFQGDRPSLDSNGHCQRWGEAYTRFANMGLMVNQPRR